MSQRVLILLPGYNVARYLDALVPEIRAALPAVDICLVDDGSADGTAEKGESLDLVVLRHDGNKGKGEALKTGFAYGIANGYDAVLTMDSDGQHLASEGQRFIASWAGGCDVVVGSRMHQNENMPWLRKRTNEFTSAVISRLAGSHIEDSQSGYRLLATSVLQSVELESSRYDLESEILIKAGRLGYVIGAVPISTIYHDEVSSINPFVDTLRFVRLVWRSLRWRRHPGIRPHAS